LSERRYHGLHRKLKLRPISWVTCLIYYKLNRPCLPRQQFFESIRKAHDRLRAANPTSLITADDIIRSFAANDIDIPKIPIGDLKLDRILRIFGLTYVPRPLRPWKNLWEIEKCDEDFQMTPCVGVCLPLAMKYIEKASRIIDPELPRKL
jgi:hypothetical protein